MVIDPAVVPVTVTLHRLADRAQEGDEKVTAPVPLTWAQVTLPVGKYPVTVAVHLEVTPARTTDLVQAMATAELLWATRTATDVRKGCTAGSPE